LDLEALANNKDIYDIKNVCHHIIKMEAQEKKKKCHNAKIGHTQNYCFKTPKCIKCSEVCPSLNCPSKKSKAKYGKCGEGHTANWKGCITYKNATEKAHQYKYQRIKIYINNKAPGH